jgi:hypothetical protein
MEAGRNAEFPKFYLEMLADSQIAVWDWVAKWEEHDFYKCERTLSGDEHFPGHSA